MTWRRHRRARATEQRELLQWTVGVALEYLLQGLGANKRDGGAWEPADFFGGLPWRAELEPVAEVSPLLELARAHLARGGDLPEHVRRRLLATEDTRTNGA